MSAEEESPEGQADLPPETNKGPLATVAAMEADLWEALVDVLTKYRNQPNSAMTAITALVNFQRSIDGELIALEKDRRMEAGLPMFDKPESDDSRFESMDFEDVGDGSVWQKIGWIPGIGTLCLTESPADWYSGFEYVGSIPGKGFIYLERLPPELEDTDLDDFDPGPVEDCEKPIPPEMSAASDYLELDGEQ